MGTARSSGGRGSVLLLLGGQRTLALGQWWSLSGGQYCSCQQQASPEEHIKGFPCSSVAQDQCHRHTHTGLVLEKLNCRTQLTLGRWGRAGPRGGAFQDEGVDRGVRDRS